MSHTTLQPVDVVLAGATGALGGRIASAVRDRGASIRAIVRRGTAPGRLAPLRAAGVEVIELDPDSLSDVTAACRGAGCVVSALNGLEPTILDTQTVLLQAAVAAGVPRFIPSDFSLDFTRTPPGYNRNLDLRRAFGLRLDAAPIRATSILNGGFAELLIGPAPFILFPLRRVLYWGDVDQTLDFTTMDDTAAFTAAVVLDPDTPRVLRIAGTQASARDLARIASEVTGQRFQPFRAGGLPLLGTLIRVLRRVAPAPGAVFPPWQGLQYMRDMFSGRGKLGPLDNNRYPDLRWTPLQDVLARR